MKLTLAIAQMHVQMAQPEENLRRAQGLAEQAARKGATLLLLPELWLNGYDLAQADSYSQEFVTSFQQRWANLARSSGLYIAGSVLAPTPDGGPANTALLLSPQGETLATYRKTHLFPPMQERTYLTPGQEIPTFDLPWGRTGLGICYDLRFPEFFRRLALQKALLVLLPAQWPIARIEHWRLLLRARSIENQFWLAACNRIGRDPNGTTFGGHSAIVDPRGEVLAEGAQEAALLLAEIDLAQAERTREQFPVLDDRRSDLY
ncbi:MAG: carbon-nitrogen family hydrolase [Chloroflexia bacterium]|nr:carbon-nitrogen family hydrolase [Chloroflexia bacterium]